MAVSQYHSPKPSGQLLLEGLAGGLGSSVGNQLGRGLGSLVGLGAEKLGFGGPSEQEKQFWVSQGFTPEQAQELAAMPPQIQQEVLKQAGGRKRAEALAPAYSQLLGGAPAQAGMGAKEEPDLIESLIKAGATEKDFQELLKAQQSQKKLGLAEEKGKREEHKLIAPTMKEYAESYKTANEGLHRIERMRDLEKEGLSNQVRQRIVEGLEGVPWNFGKPLAAAFQGLFPLDPASQEFQKLSQEFLREIKSIFGARISNLEVENYMKSIPTLVNTPEGRKRIYKNLEYMYQGKKLPFKIAKEIKKEHGGKVPYDIDELVTERLKKRQKELAKKIDFSVPEKNEISGKSKGETAPETMRDRINRASQETLPYQGSVRTTIEDLFS